MSDLPGDSPEMGIASVPLPETMVTEKPLDSESMALLQGQWSLFNSLKDQPGPTVNPIRERLARGEPALAKGTLVHGSLYSPELVEGVSRMGVVSGELIGIPEDGETNYCADFYKVPEDMSVVDYVDWVAAPASVSSMITAHRTEYGRVPTKLKSAPLVAFLIDPSDDRLSALLSNDAYDNNNAKMKDVISRRLFDEEHEAFPRLSSILVGIPSNFISGMIIGSQVKPEEVQYIREVMGENVVLFDTLGTVLSPPQAA